MMENKYFKAKDTLFSICERYPETISIFVANGFKQFHDEQKRAKLGKTLTLQTALKIKKINIETFSKLLIEGIEAGRCKADASLNVAQSSIDEDAVKLKGLLPCPVRIPMVEELDRFISNYQKKYDIPVIYDLKAASAGLDWLIETIEDEDNADELADIFISAGFDLFFEDRLMGKFKKMDVFADSTGFDKLNKDMDNGQISIKDPMGHYSMIGVVPAVFLVNRHELGERRMPRTWADILKPEFAQSVSLPVGDFDLFNSILLNIYKIYGDDGIKGLGRCLLEGMHPSQMVKSHVQKNKRPAVTIMPYFFTKMVKEGGVLEAVWPEDGAIISPIFMLSKKNRQEQLQPLIDFLASPQVGEILSHQGLFPSTHPGVDNRLADGNKFMWLGWDYIYSNDIGELIRTCDNTFRQTLQMQSRIDLSSLKY